LLAGHFKEEMISRCSTCADLQKASVGDGTIPSGYRTVRKPKSQRIRINHGIHQYQE